MPSSYDNSRIQPVQQEYDGKLNFATDGWSSSNHKSYIAITVHLERAGQPFKMLLDLVEVAKSHTGVNLGIAFVNVLKTFGVEEKVRLLNNYRSLTYIVHVLQILGITGDNASNNDSMIKYLGDTLDDFPGPANQTWCFVHTVNLIAKSILKPFDTRKAKETQSFNDIANALLDLEEGHDSEECMEDTPHTPSDGEEEEVDKDKEDNSEDEEDGDELDTNLEPIRTMLSKV